MDQTTKVLRLKQWMKICRFFLFLFAILSVYALLPRENITLLASGGMLWLILAVVFGVQTLSLHFVAQALPEIE